jgi:hypothetical protein
MKPPDSQTRDEMKPQDIDHKEMWDNFLAWYNTSGNIFFDNEQEAWLVFYTILNHEWKQYAD